MPSKWQVITGFSDTKDDTIPKPKNNKRKSSINESTSASSTTSHQNTQQSRKRNDQSKQTTKGSDKSNALSNSEGVHKRLGSMKLKVINKSPSEKRIKTIMSLIALTADANRLIHR